MKYLKKFNTYTEYESYIGGEPLLPNVSICADNEDKNHIHYNPLIPPLPPIQKLEFHDKSTDEELLSPAILVNGSFTLKVQLEDSTIFNADDWTDTGNNKTLDLSDYMPDPEFVDEVIRKFYYLDDNGREYYKPAYSVIGHRYVMSDLKLTYKNNIGVITCYYFNYFN